MTIRYGHTPQTSEMLFTRLVNEGISLRTIRRIRWVLGPLLGALPGLRPRHDVRLTEDQWLIEIRPAALGMKASGIEERHNTLTDEELADIARPLLGTGP